MRNLTLDDLTLHGISVSTSGLMQLAYRAAYCDLLLNVTAKNKSAALATFRDGGEFGDFSGLRISGVNDLSFLKEFPDLLYLEMLSPAPVNVRQLNSLANLRGLRLESPSCGIDFACFKELEVFIGDWHVDNCNLDQSRELRRLHLRHFNPRSHDLTELANITRLEHLRIAQTSIKSLHGLETLEDVRTLGIAYSLKLETLSALATGNCGIREIEFDKAKKIKSYAPIASVAKLRRLRLSSCAPMQDLKWITGMNYLDMLSLVDTNVIGGDLSPVLRLPMLRYVGTLDKKHYNYTGDALNQILKTREGRNAKRDKAR